MADLSCYRLPKDITDATLVQQARKMRALRLLSLQTDPTNFISRYEDEVKQPLKFSIDRVSDPVAEHFVAASNSQSMNGEPSEPESAYDAFLVLLKESKDFDVNKAYHLGAVYVRPHLRGKGVCTRLIQQSIDWARDDSQRINAKSSVIHLTATASNTAAQRLYCRLGFEEVSRAIEKTRDNEDLQVVNMELRLI